MNSQHALIVAHGHYKELAKTDPNMVPILRGLEVSLQKVKVYDSIMKKVLVVEDETPYESPFLKKMLEESK